MKLFVPKYPAILKLFYPGRITKINNSQAIYLTFDDGPVPEATPWVLDMLKKYNAKATFFCIGDNVNKNPEIFRRITAEGHAIGNHTFHHLNGWKTSNSRYIKEARKVEETLSNFSDHLIDSKKDKQILQKPNYPLFRPPYGKIKNKQAQQLTEMGYKLVMWDVISGDYDQDFSAEKCYKNVIENAVPGSSIVFHDSKKAFKNLEIILPKILEYYSGKGLEFRTLKDVL